MAKMSVKGIREVQKMLDGLGSHSKEIAERALYEGAGVMYHYVATALVEVPTDDFFGTPERQKAGPLTVQKADLQKSLGIAPFRNKNGKLDTSIGFDGYNRVKTKQYPSGEPNVVVARRVERGTSYMRSNPFVSQAKKDAERMTVETMKQTVEDEVKKHTK